MATSKQGDRYAQTIKEISAVEEELRGQLVGLAERLEAAESKARTGEGKTPTADDGQLMKDLEAAKKRVDDMQDELQGTKEVSRIRPPD